MDKWNEIRTAAQVARTGTISAAADALGLHRATVTRHVDTLEAVLGGKLFLRHARGFTPTALGLDLLRVADATDDQFGQLQRRATQQSGGLTGELVITCVEMLMADLLPALHLFRSAHPHVTVRFITSPDVLRLEYGEAHIAVRGGRRPDDPDNVVLPFRRLRMGLYATQAYVDRHGQPSSPSDYGDHIFVGPASENPRAPFLSWMIENVPAEAISLRSDQSAVMKLAILAGFGIGFLPKSFVRAQGGLVEIMKPRPEWVVGTWIVTHVDLHRTAKVQAFLNALKTVRTDPRSAPLPDG
jgi:DNA-binding transcriptional LysR family regulator